MNRQRGKYWDWCIAGIRTDDIPAEAWRRLTPNKHTPHRPVEEACIDICWSFVCLLRIKIFLKMCVWYYHLGFGVYLQSLYQYQSLLKGQCSSSWTTQWKSFTVTSFSFSPLSELSHRITAVHDFSVVKANLETPCRSITVTLIGDCFMFQCSNHFYLQSPPLSHDISPWGWISILAPLCPLVLSRRPGRSCISAEACSRRMLLFLSVNNRSSPVSSFLFTAVPPFPPPSPSLPLSLSCQFTQSIDVSCCFSIPPSLHSSTHRSLSLCLSSIPCLLLDLMCLSIRLSLAQSRLDMVCLPLACYYCFSYTCGCVMRWHRLTSVSLSDSPLHHSRCSSFQPSTWEGVVARHKLTFYCPPFKKNLLSSFLI